VRRGFCVVSVPFIVSDDGAEGLTMAAIIV
jgi:hypothetical protein